jgi:hypothetical protein
VTAVRVSTAIGQSVPDLLPSTEDELLAPPDADGVAFIAGANDDPRGFSLLAMVFSLFETGDLSCGTGIFEAAPGILSRQGVAVRVVDAMRRGAEVPGSVDFLAVDCFEHSGEEVGAVSEHFGVTPKSDGVLPAGSAGPFKPGGISEFQLDAGRRMADSVGRAYDSLGASL